jgi:O-antigen ligase
LGLVLFIQMLSPGSLASIRGQLQPNRLHSDNSVLDRQADYDAVTPDIDAHPALGRGWGSYDPKKYRVLDNQLLGTAVMAGWVGVGVFVALIVAAFGAGHRALRTRSSLRAPPGYAAAAAAVVFGVVSTLFDSLSFPQVPYVFLTIAGLAVVASSGDR